MKRLTVKRRIKKMLAEATHFLKNEPMITDCNQVYGSYDKESTDRAITNANTDVDQLQFVLWALENREEITKLKAYEK